MLSALPRATGVFDLTLSFRLRKLQPVLVCCAVITNALCAGGVYSFPLISPALVAHMKLTQPQLTTIALAGMVGQYPFAPFVGKLLDRYGPRMCSFLAAILFSLGFGLFSWEIASTPDEISRASSASFRRLVAYFAMAGLATVLSYFSIVFSATKALPNYMGVASGTSMALFGFSPLVLSVVANRFFTHQDTGLDVTHFLALVAFLAGSTHLLGALCMQGPEPKALVDTPTIAMEDEENIPSTSTPSEPLDNESDNEAQPLLYSNKPKHATVHADVDVILVPEPEHGTVGDLLKDGYFWVLIAILVVLIGVAEMVMGNLGSIYLSLPSSSGRSPDVSTAVQLLSASNTLTRLSVGPLADAVSPVASYVHSGIWSFPRKQHFSRVAFLFGACVLLAVTCVWLEIGIRTREAIWSLSIGIGIVYGTTFTILPSILSSIWGLPNLGRNFGIISYAPFVGTTLFSYLYAFVAAAFTFPSEDACSGVICWRLTFWLSTMLAAVAAGGSLVLWRKWSGRV